MLPAVPHLLLVDQVQAAQVEGPEPVIPGDLSDPAALPVSRDVERQHAPTLVFMNL